MKFDKSKVYTALNADELKEGDVVITIDPDDSIAISQHIRLSYAGWLCDTALSTVKKLEE